MQTLRTTLFLLLLAGCSNGPVYEREPGEQPEPMGDAGVPEVPVVGEDASVPTMPPPPPPIPSGPRPLRCGRTYDGETDYLVPSAGVSFVAIAHRDNTSLPSYEGGASCGDGCTETVARLADGATLTGTFTDMQTFSVQGAMTADEGVGTLVVDACGVEIGRWSLRVDRSSLPGFINLPSPGWPVPTAETCAFTIRAVGGFAYVRAVTTQCRTAIAPPIVDLRVNGEDGPIVVPASEPFTLSWSSLNAAECQASSAWSGVRAPDGEEEASATSTVTYTITCANEVGTASDEVTVEIVSGPI